MRADREMLQVRAVVALPDGTVYMGCQRLRAAQESGWETIPTIFTDVPWEVARARAIRDNNSFGEWELPALAEMLAVIEREGTDLGLVGFDSAELDGILAQLPVTTDPDEPPDLPAGAPDSTPGERYELGEHVLLCADATHPEQLARLIGNGRPELVWTDPPYGIAYQGKTRRRLTIQNDGENAAGVFAAALAAADPFLAASARFYVCVPAGRQGTMFRLAIDDVGWHLHQSLVWVKDRFVLGHGDHQAQHEEILYGWRPGPGRPGRGRHPGSRWFGGNSVGSVFFFDRPARSEAHPTMKPVGLVGAQLANSTRRGDLVLDPFAGSGTTLIACEQLGRRCLAVEIDPAYCDVIRRRYEDYTRG